MPEPTRGSISKPRGAPSAAPSTSVSWRSVAIPAEHGGWSLTAEPVLLGLLVSWSLAGLALGLAAFVAFVARTPMKLVLVDRWRHRHLDRTGLAIKIAVVELAILVALAVAVTVYAEGRFWVPLVIAIPLIVLELWFDMRSRSRRLIPELAGSIGIASVAASIALAGGSSNRLALGLWLVLAARSVAAIPYVRVQISKARNRVQPSWHSDAAQVVAVVAAMVGWLVDAVPGAAVIAIAVLGALNLVAIRLRPPRIVVIGIQQMVVGLAVVATTAIAVSVS